MNRQEIRDLKQKRATAAREGMAASKAVPLPQKGESMSEYVGRLRIKAANGCTHCADQIERIEAHPLYGPALRAAKSKLSLVEN